MCTHGGASPLLVAAQNGHLPVVKVLLDRIPDCVGLNTPRSDGATALYMASQQGYHEVVDMLIQRRADMNATLPSPKRLGCGPHVLLLLWGSIELCAREDSLLLAGVSGTVLRRLHVFYLLFLLPVGTDLLCSFHQIYTYSGCLTLPPAGILLL